MNRVVTRPYYTPSHRGPYVGQFISTDMRWRDGSVVWKQVNSNGSLINEQFVFYQVKNRQTNKMTMIAMFKRDGANYEQR